VVSRSPAARSVYVRCTVQDSSLRRCRALLYLGLAPLVSCVQMVGSCSEAPPPAQAPLLLGLLAVLTGASALDNGLGLLPPMGWRNCAPGFRSALCIMLTVC
jgi:hypothetical protein